MIHTCQTCKREFSSTRKESKYCSNACKFSAARKQLNKYTCKFCGVEFEKYVPPSDKTGHRLFCSRSCQMRAHKLNLGHKTKMMKKFTCERCQQEFYRLNRSNNVPYRFCSNSCAQKTLSINARSFEAVYTRWVKRYGAEEADKRLVQFKRKRSEATIKNNLKRIVSDETKEKIRNSCKNIPNVLKNKTFVEFYGVDRARELSALHSEKLKQSYASGKISPTARTKRAPIYKGRKLRSLLELAAIHMLEARDTNVVFGETLLYEDKHMRFIWYDELNVKHIYTPDLYCVIHDIVYEVKPQWKINNESFELAAKRKAVLSAKRSFAYITDDDVSEIYRMLLTDKNINF